MIIHDNTNKPVSRYAVIAKYFRKQDETLSDFNGQLKKLTEADKDELAMGAAKELGYTIVDSSPTPTPVTTS